MLDRLPRSDRRAVRNMAAAAGSDPEDMALEIIRAYLGLVRAAPAALPADPLRGLATSALRRGV